MPVPRKLATCDVHIAHRPRPITLEWHHLIPRAWQRFWVPADATVKFSSDYGPTWNQDGVWVCPTGHRNVHAAIVVAMRGGPLTGARSERKVADKALALWVAAGGSLEALRVARLWGEF